MVPLSVITEEDEAKGWLKAHLNVSRETFEKIDLLISELTRESAHQNLIAPSTFPHIWVRHILDSAQLLTLAKSFGHVQPEGTWLDLGTGAGFPGLIIALLSSWKVTMVESRSRRADYLQDMIEKLDLSANATLIGSRVEKIEDFPASVISARAFAPLKRLMPLAARFSTEKTLWLLPKGRSASNELDELGAKWQHMFHVKHSITDESARILAGYLSKTP